MEDRPLEEEKESQTFQRHEYAQKDFWNKRFTEYKSPFDWYITWTEMKKFACEYFPKETIDNVLMVGCGNSSNI